MAPLDGPSMASDVATKSEVISRAQESAQLARDGYDREVQGTDNDVLKFEERAKQYYADEIGEIKILYRNNSRDMLRIEMWGSDSTSRLLRVPIAEVKPKDESKESYNVAIAPTGEVYKYEYNGDKWRLEKVNVTKGPKGARFTVLSEIATDPRFQDVHEFRIGDAHTFSSGGSFKIVQENYYTEPEVDQDLSSLMYPDGSIQKAQNLMSLQRIERQVKNQTSNIAGFHKEVKDTLATTGLLADGSQLPDMTKT